MQNKPIALITGANKGIGFQVAKDLAAHGLTVLIGSRNFEQGQAAAKSIGTDAHALQLDVTDQSSIAAAAESVRREFGRLDVLVNNAGISHVGTQRKPLTEMMKSGLLTVASLDDVRAVFETNVFGVIAVTQAMLPLLREAPLARIVNISSSGGSLSRMSGASREARATFGAYSSSKTALNGITLAFAFALEEEGIKVNAAAPGFISTALTNFEGTRTVAQGAREAVRLALLGPDGPTGTFSDEDGPVAW